MIPTCQAWVGLDPPLSVKGHQAQIIGSRRDRQGEYHDHAVKVCWE